MRLSTEGGTAVWLLFANSMIAASVLQFASPAYGRALGVEAYLYGEVPVPAHVIADNFIDREILPKLQPELSPLWHEVKDAAQPMDRAMDASFLARGMSIPGANLRQAYLRKLLLVKQLRDAIVIYEQIPLTPDSFVARFGKHGYPPTEARAFYLAKVATYISGGDNPQQAALKAAVAYIHERDRQRGIPESRIDECYFENPQTRVQDLCANLIAGIDQVFRDESFAEMFPLDEQAIRALASQSSTTEELIRRRASIIDVISGTFGLRNGYRPHRETAIQAALDQREEYRVALLRRKSRPTQSDRDSSGAGPLSGFFGAVVAGMVGVFVLAEISRSSRASDNAANSKWIGHENDEWCYVEHDYNYQLNTPVEQWQPEVTYCVSYNGFIRSATGLFSHCKFVEGWCPAE